MEFTRPHNVPRDEFVCCVSGPGVLSSPGHLPFWAVPQCVHLCLALYDDPFCVSHPSISPRPHVTQVFTCVRRAPVPVALQALLYVPVPLLHSVSVSSAQRRQP